MKGLESTQRDTRGLGSFGRQVSIWLTRTRRVGVEGVCCRGWAIDVPPGGTANRAGGRNWKAKKVFFVDRNASSGVKDEEV